MLEADVLKSCISLLDILQAQKKLAFRRVNVSGILRSKGSKTVLTKNPAKGISDLFVWPKNRPFLAIEAKSTKGRLTADQIIFKYQIEQMGHPYYVIRSVDELASIIESYGISVPKFSSALHL